MSDSRMSPGAALDLLIEGNRRFVDNAAIHPASDKNARESVINGQSPFATILTCSDSRVPPEIIFVRGIGDLFIIRVAGNILDSTVKGSLAYAVEHLKCPLVVVLGHSSCGAVTASLADDAALKDEPETILALVGDIRKNIPGARTKASHEGHVTEAVLENARKVRDQIKADPTAKAAIDTGTTDVKAAFYSLESGEVEWLD